LLPPFTKPPHSCCAYSGVILQKIHKKYYIVNNN
jgi:hypothetical protein